MERAVKNNASERLRSHHGAMHIEFNIWNAPSLYKNEYIALKESWIQVRSAIVIKTIWVVPTEYNSDSNCIKSAACDSKFVNDYNGKITTHDDVKSPTNFSTTKWIQKSELCFSVTLTVQHVF